MGFAGRVRRRENLQHGPCLAQGIPWATGSACPRVGSWKGVVKKYKLKCNKKELKKNSHR